MIMINTHTHTYTHTTSCHRNDIVGSWNESVILLVKSTLMHLFQASQYINSKSYIEYDLLANMRARKRYILKAALSP